MALYLSDAERYRRTMESVDALSTSTDFLAGQALGLGKPIHVHRNGFSLQMLRLSVHARSSRPPTRDRTAMGYASGTPTHDRDFQQAKPALERMLHMYPESILWVIGPLDVGGDWGALSGRIVHIPLVPWQQLPPLLAQFDINIAPLEADNPFCQAESEVRYISQP